MEKFFLGGGDEAERTLDLNCLVCMEKCDTEPFDKQIVFNINAPKR